jgi:molybdate transport system substrate-binding protein
MMHGRQPQQVMVAAALAAVLVTGCSGTSVQRAEVLVSAAASLTEAFAAMEVSFEAAHPDLDVVLNLAGSSILREQILGGAPVDVFASADFANMDRLVEAGAIAGNPTLFARNSMLLVVPAGNPGGVSGLEDLGAAELLIGLCAEGVPCGDFAHRVLNRAGVRAAVDTYEPDVRALLAKIEAGELDAGIVYLTDVPAGGGGVVGIAIPPEHNVTAEYPVAVLMDAPNRNGAGAFVSFVLSGDGRSILARHGFGLP